MGDMTMMPIDNLGGCSILFSVGSLLWWPSWLEVPCWQQSSSMTIAFGLVVILIFVRFSIINYAILSMGKIASLFPFFKNIFSPTKIQPLYFIQSRGEDPNVPPIFITLK
jgi:hypothetical protein